MRPSLDPLRYGLGALEEMAREQASVALPARVDGDRFAPHPQLRPLARSGAALSLRLFGTTEDDATALVLGDEGSRAFAPVPPRAAPFFEAHAAVLAQDGEDELLLGFPLATFVDQGSSRVAPLFSRGGARARWTLGDEAWAIPPGARLATPLTIPDGLVLEAPDGEVPYGLHGGVWHLLFGLDGAALSAIAAAGRASLGALVRAATRVLVAGPEDAASAADVEGGPLSAEDLRALCEAATARAPSPRRALRCHPHGLAMLPPRGDPTSGLRRELRALLESPAPERGPLAVYLGAPAAPLRERAIWACSTTSPTPSQLAAARALEGTADLVAVRGPPGCGKTALLHHVAAQAVVDMALGDTWTSAPSPTGTPWALVVTSTNNGAVDHALAPFVRAPALALPLGLRLGSRRTLAEVTAAALEHALDALHAHGAIDLAGARAAFEARARPAREHLRARREAEGGRGARAAKVRALEQRAAALREALARAPGEAIATGEPPPLADIEVAVATLREHAEAAARLAPLHLGGQNASAIRACAKWAKANELRGPRILPVLRALALAAPFGALDEAQPREDIERQRAAMLSTLARLERARDALAVPGQRRELEEITASLEAQREELREGEPSPDPALFEAALAVRDAWARAHRAALVPCLRKALSAVREEPSAERGRPPHALLRPLAPLFPVAGCTLLSMRSAFPLEPKVIDRLVIDEAAQCAPVYAVPALARARRAMLTGDTAQLPPVYTLDPRAGERVARGLDAAALAPFRMEASSTASAQSAAEPRASARLALVEHFRSQRAIVALASRWSGYALDVRTKERSLAHISPRLASPVVMLAVRGHGERAAEGVVNAAEAKEAVALVDALVRDGVAPGDVAVLTPFVGQCVRIERELLARGLLAEGGVTVSTVHRLQGGERRVVVFSVAATQRRHLRWLAERPHLLHVATSRAQDHLVVLLDPDAAELEPGLAPLRDALVRTPATSAPA